MSQPHESDRGSRFDVMVAEGDVERDRLMVEGWRPFFKTWFSPKDWNAAPPYVPTYYLRRLAHEQV